MARRNSSREAARRRTDRARNRNRVQPAHSSLGRSLYRRPLRIEPLEDRRLLAVVTVTTVADTVDFNDGVTSLREAIFATNLVPGADTINFATSLTVGGPAKIVLTHGRLDITDALTINGPSAALLTVDASGNDPTPSVNDGLGSQVFNIDDGNSALINVTLAGMTITGGDKNLSGGGIASLENLTLTGVVVRDNAIDGNTHGGGIYSLGALQIVDSGIENNDATGANSNAGVGGGIYCRGGFSISNSRISNNLAHYGGGIFATYGNGTLNGVTITGNSSDRAGGGVALFYGDLAVTDSTIANNFAKTGKGGGLVVVPGTITLTNSTISGNSSMFGGGGIYTTRLKADHSVINNNHVTSGSGGGIWAGRVTLDSSAVSGNSAEDSGGGVYCIGTVTVSNSTITGNSAAGNGGGLAGSTFYKMNIASTTISGNVAGMQGGGIWAPRVNLILANSTISGNQASEGGGAFVVDGFGQIGHTIVAANTAASGPDLLGLMGNAIAVTFSLIGDNSGGDLVEAPVGSPDVNGNLIGGPVHGVIDPLLGPLADNGGFELPNGSHILTHALLPGSPAINAGDLNAVAGVGGVPEFDERGTPFGRIVGGRIDIGAFEYQTPTDLNLLVDTLVDESDGNYSRGDLSLREAIELANANNYVGVVDTIHFDPALTASGPATILLTHGELKVTDSLTIQGPSAELLTIDASGNDPTPTVNDGNGTRVFNIGSGLVVSIGGLTLTGGDSSLRGGAIFNKVANLTLHDSVITGNATHEFGGGVYASSGTVRVESTIVSNNVAAGQGGPGQGGGGLFIRSSDLTIRESVISGNTALFGGGLYFKSYARQGSKLNVIDTTISENHAFDSGGGIWSDLTGGTIVLTGTTIENNRSGELQPAMGRGGGIYANLTNASAIISSTTIRNNIALSGGGAWFRTTHGELLITDTGVSGNSAVGVSGPGGGLYVTGSQQSTTTVRNSTVSGNNTLFDSGGGIFSTGVEMNLEQSTVSGNTATKSGGGLSHSSGSLHVLNSTITANVTGLNNGIAGIWFQGSTLFNALVNHSIVASNYQRFFAGGDIGGVPIGNVSVRYSLIGSNTGSSLTETLPGLPDANGNLIGGPVHGVIDPLLGPLADNGGPTMTHALLPGSPAIDAGDPTAIAGVGGVPKFDQRGAPFTRVYGGQIDIGAVEVLPAGFLPGDNNANGVVDAADYTVWRDTLGSVSNLRADGNGDGVVNSLDYDVWKSNFGAMLAGVGGSGAVAEEVRSEVRRTSGDADGATEAVFAIGSGWGEQPANLAGVRAPLRNRAPDESATRRDWSLAAWVAGRERGSRRGERFLGEEIVRESACAEEGGDLALQAIDRALEVL